MNIDLKEQKKRFEESDFFRANDFILIIGDNEHQIDECTISDAYFTGNELHVMVRDKYLPFIFEEWLDKLTERKWRRLFRRKRINVSLSKITLQSACSVYTMKLKNARVVKYESSGYSYGSAIIHSHHLTIRFDRKEYLFDNPGYIEEIDKWKNSCNNTEELNEKTVKILENSNKLLEDAKDTIKARAKRLGNDTKSGHVSAIKAIDKVQHENETEIKLKTNKTRKPKK